MHLNEGFESEVDRGWHADVAYGLARVSPLEGYASATEFLSGAKNGEITSPYLY